jgi:hypothetical protein
MRRKTYKRKINKRKNKTLRKMKGGVLREIPVTSILMTDPIRRAIRAIDDKVVVKGFKGYPGEHGYNLQRLANNHNLTMPISVRPYRSTSFYTIEDGRHRFAKLVASGKTHIIVNVIED